MTTATFTLLHVLISLAGIASGLVVMYGFLASKRLDRWTVVFLATTIATSLTVYNTPGVPSSAGTIWSSFPAGIC